MRKITFLPDGGLGNRMRSVCSALQMARDVNAELEIVWLRDWALNARFDSIFEPVIPELREARWWENTALHHTSRKGLLGIPWVYKSVAFHRHLEEQDTQRMNDRGKSVAEWVLRGSRDERTCIASCLKFHPYDDADFSRLFVPIPSIRTQIEERCAPLGEHAVGVHIRRGDHKTAIDASPLPLFFDYLDKECDSNACTTIYLATDSEEVKLQLKARYGNRLHTSPQVADRGSTSGIQESVVEMYTLSNTNKIYGSFRSSFSNLASKLGQKPLIIVKREDIEESGITF